MAASDPELKDGLTLPAWMKTRPTREFEPFAGSPPAPEDSFFFIKYPKTDLGLGKQNVDQDLLKVVQEHQSDAVAANYSKDKDWSKHTKPCQEVLHGIAPINTAGTSSTSKPKPAGTDDGFKGEGAACGNSIVKVAHQMVSNRQSAQRGFAIAVPEEDQAEFQRYKLSARRGSKSLPTTPVHSPPGSPNSRRRKNGNRYFTSPFEPVTDASSRSWLTMALLGFKKDLTTSTSTLAEEDTIDTRLHGSLAESVENLGPAPKGREPKILTAEPSPAQPPKPAKTASAFRPKPSELREMNFWSPTSM